MPIQWLWPIQIQFDWITGFILIVLCLPWTTSRSVKVIHVGWNQALLCGFRGIAEHKIWSFLHYIFSLLKMSLLFQALNCIHQGITNVRQIHRFPGCMLIMHAPQSFLCHLNLCCLPTEDGKYLEGEDRIAYLMGKIQDLRKIYMGLKAEVACIDRRRKRHRRKEREGTAHFSPSLNFHALVRLHKWIILPAAQAAAFAAAQAAVDAVASQEHVVVNHHGNQWP